MLIALTAQAPVVISNRGPSWWTLLVVALIGAFASALAAFATYKATTSAEAIRLKAEHQRAEVDRDYNRAELRRRHELEAANRVESVLLRLHDHAGRTYSTKSLPLDERLSVFHALNALDAEVIAAVSHLSGLEVAEACLFARSCLYEAAKSDKAEHFATEYDKANEALRNALNKLGAHRRRLHADLGTSDN